MRSAVIIITYELTKPLVEKFTLCLKKNKLNLEGYLVAAGCNTTYLAVSSQSHKPLFPHTFSQRFELAYVSAGLPAVPKRISDQYRILNSYALKETANEMFQTEIDIHRFKE